MGTNEATVDLAGRNYWNHVWEHEEFPPDVEPRSTSLWLHRDRLFHQTFTRVLSGRPSGLRLIELGCARSAWLPYFAREFQFEVAGLDYSELGARQAAERLRTMGIAGEIRCADLFDPPTDWTGAFDVVSWFGVAEHFQDTTAAIRAASALLKPGGLLITEIPNLAGLNGWIQRWFNKPLYDMHVPLSASELAAHHAAAGLQVQCSEYVVPTDFGVIDVEQVPPGLARRCKDRVLHALRILSGCVWWLDRRIGPLRPGRFTGAFIIVAAEKPKDADSLSGR